MINKQEQVMEIDESQLNDEYFCFGMEIRLNQMKSAMIEHKMDKQENVKLIVQEFEVGQKREVL
ncbi:TPA: hypothetical protein DIC40_06515 [Patescibacteria group bacterium]|nr:hypothetical protein [Candidatus Gracilibacteria bacterium]